jgi:hypothetical protein
MSCTFKTLPSEDIENDEYNQRLKYGVVTLRAPSIDFEYAEEFYGKTDCRDCDGSGFFYQMEDTPCNCRIEDK